MKLNLLVAGMMAAMLPVGGAYAADNSGKMYVFGTAGMSRYKVDDLDAYYTEAVADYNAIPGVTATGQDDDSDLSFALGAGYQINPYVAVEGFYRNYGELRMGLQAAGNGASASEEDRLKAAGLGAGLVGFLPLTEAFSLSLRVDAVGLRLKDDYHTEDSSGSSSDESLMKTKLTLGLGVGGQYNFANGFSLRADVQHIRGELGDDDESSKVDINTISLGVVQAF